MISPACKTRVQSDSQGSDCGMIFKLANTYGVCLHQIPSCWLLRKQPPPERSTNNAHFNTFRRAATRRVRILVPLRHGGGAVMSPTYIQFKSDREGWVYLIHAQGTDRYKIGRCIDIPARKRRLQTQSPYPLKVVLAFKSSNAARDEAHWHKVYSDYRVYGEWFSFSDDYIKEVVSLYFWSKHDENRVFNLAEQLARMNGVNLLDPKISNSYKYAQEASSRLGIDLYDCQFRDGV